MENKEKNDFRLHDDDMMTFTILVLLTSTNNFFLFYYFFPFKWLFGCTIIHYTRPFKTTTYFSLYLLLLLINFARWLNIVYYWLTAIATKWHTFKCPKTRESTWTLVIMLLCSSIDFQRDKLPLATIDYRVHSILPTTTTPWAICSFWSMYTSYDRQA